MKPNTYVPIGGTIEYKRSAIQCHRSQLELLDYSAAFVGLAAYRAIFCRGARYAEAFSMSRRSGLNVDLARPGRFWAIAHHLRLTFWPSGLCSRGALVGQDRHGRRQPTRPQELGQGFAQRRPIRIRRAAGREAIRFDSEAADFHHNLGAAIAQPRQPDAPHNNASSTTPARQSQLDKASSTKPSSNTTRRSD